MERLFRSGDVTVVIELDSHTRLHRLLPPGCYRAIVRAGDGDVVDRLLMSVPAGFARKPEALGAMRQIAVTALAYSAADHPQLPIARIDQGLPAVEAA